MSGLLVIAEGIHRGPRGVGSLPGCCTPTSPSFPEDPHISREHLLEAPQGTAWDVLGLCHLLCQAAWRAPSAGKSRAQLRSCRRGWWAHGEPAAGTDPASRLCLFRGEKHRVRGSHGLHGGNAANGPAGVYGRGAGSTQALPWGAGGVSLCAGMRDGLPASPSCTCCHGPASLPFWQ